MRDTRGKKILVVCLQGIGNTFLTLYALEKFMEERSVRLSIVVSNNGSHELALSQLPIDRLYIWDESKSAARNIFHLGRGLLRERFDEAYLAYPSGGREGMIGLFARACEKKVVVDGAGGPRLFMRFYKTRIVKRIKTHDINTNFLLLGVPNNGYLRSGKTVIEGVRKGFGWYGKRFLYENNLSGKFIVAVHPGAKGYGKRWDTEKFIKLCKTLNERFGCRFVVVGGNDELALKQTVANGIGENALLLNTASIFQTASVLQRCNLFIGNDSAPMHMSAILGVPVIALWGYTDFNRTAPYGPGNIIIRKAYDCSPCYSFTGRFKDDCRHGLRCIKDLSLEEVLPVAAGYIEVLLSKNGKAASEDMKSLRIGGVERIYELEHACVVVDLKG
ncbi:MAG: glycosyltransferase family 9 protein [Deltaproteobacteria bacterium]|nr:glycosyltransferase family 9 protein [Deltaproteobacteria bacterium]